MRSMVEGHQLSRSAAIAQWVTSKLPTPLQPQDALGMQVGLGSPLHGQLWLFQRWLCRLDPWGSCVHGGDEQQHHQQLSSEEQVDLGHGDKDSVGCE